jgi:MSHA biogenesis protein MshP
MQNRGFSLVSAIFLLVVIAALGTFAVTLSTTQQQSAALDVMGARAYQAARAGIEWGAYQVISNPAGISCPVGGASNAVAMPAGSTLAPFGSVDVSCWSYAPVSEASNTVTMYRLQSTATQGVVATPGYVEREISVTIAQ